MNLKEKLDAEAKKYGATVTFYLGAYDVTLPDSPDAPKHWKATGSMLLCSPNISLLLEDMAYGTEGCNEDCDHWCFDPEFLIDLVKKNPLQ